MAKLKTSYKPIGNAKVNNKTNIALLKKAISHLDIKINLIGLFIKKNMIQNNDTYKSVTRNYVHNLHPS